MRSESSWLVAAGTCSAAVAVLHLAVIFVGAPGYRYFGAGERLSDLAQHGSPVPALITTGIVGVFAAIAWYGFAGAGLVARPPALRRGLVFMSSVFLFRGLLVVPQVVVLFVRPGAVPFRGVAFSAAALAIGLCYAVGTWRLWRKLNGVPNASGQ